MCTSHTQISNINLRYKRPFNRLLGHTRVKAVMYTKPVGAIIKGHQISKLQNERRVLMCKRTKLSRIILRTPQIISQLFYIEEQISSSHLKEKIHEEHVAVSKIEVDPKYFFRYAKRHRICSTH